MRVEVKIYDDEGALQRTLTAQPRGVGFEDIYEPVTKSDWRMDTFVRPPKRNGLVVTLTDLLEDVQGRIYTIRDERNPDNMTSATQAGVVNFVLVPAKNKNDRHEVMQFECDKCHQLFTSKQLEIHTLEHGGWICRTDLRATLPKTTEENNA